MNINEIRKIVREVLNENKNNTINKKYTHFAVMSDGKIVNGWDYSDYDQEELNSDKKSYFKDDIRDLDLNPKDVRILTLKALQRKNVNPFDSSNWKNPWE